MCLVSVVSHPCVIIIKKSNYVYFQMLVTHYEVSAGRGPAVPNHTTRACAELRLSTTLNSRKFSQVDLAQQASSRKHGPTAQNLVFPEKKVLLDGTCSPAVNPGVLPMDLNRLSSFNLREQER